MAGGSGGAPELTRSAGEAAEQDHPRAGNCFEVVLTRTTPAARLGLRLNPSERDPTRTVVAEVLPEGLVHEYNRTASPAVVVRKGDEVDAINGQREATRFGTECQAPRIVLQLLRFEEGPGQEPTAAAEGKEEVDGDQKVVKDKGSLTAEAEQLRSCVAVENQRQNDLRSLRAELTCLRQEIDGLRETQAVKTEIAELRSQESSLQDEVERRTELESSCAKLKVENVRLRTQEQQLEVEMHSDAARAQEELERLLSENVQLRAQLAAVGSTMGPERLEVAQEHVAQIRELSLHLLSSCC